MRSNWLAVLVCVALLSVTGVGAATSSLPHSGGVAAAPDGELPPGVTEDGVENATALVEAHRTALVDAGFVSETRSSITVSPMGLQVESVEVGVVGAGLSTYRTRSTGFATKANCTVEIDAEQWGNASVLLTRYEFGNETQYAKQYLNQSPEAPGASELASSPQELREAGLTQSLLLASVLQSGDFAIAETRTVDGRTLTTLRAEKLNESIASQPGASNVSHYDASITVDETGIVRSLTITGAVDEGDQRARFSYAFEVLALGPDEPLQPTWAPSALDTVTADISIEPAEDRFVVANERGDPLPPGTTIQITHANASHDLVLDEGLEPGEAVYVYYPADERPPVVASEPPANDSARELSGEYEFVVRTPDGQVLVTATYGIGNGRSVSTTSGGLDPFSECEGIEQGLYPRTGSIEGEVGSR